MPDRPARIQSLASHSASLPHRTRDLVEAAGFQVYNSGGNLMVFARFPDGDSGDQIMVSDINNEIHGDPDAAIWQIGRYGDDGARIDVEENYPLEEALLKASALPSPGAGAGAMDETFPTFDAAVSAAQTQAIAP